MIAQAREIHTKSRETCGTRRIAAALRQKEFPVSRFRARTLMKKAGIAVRSKRKFKSIGV